MFKTSMMAAFAVCAIVSAAHADDAAAPAAAAPAAAAPAAGAPNTAKKAEMKADRETINAACTADATTAGCGNEKVGTGLLKCLHAYKKAHAKDFNFSPGCKTAMQQMHTDKMAH